jgi:hypothetical protein
MQEVGWGAINFIFYTVVFRQRKRCRLVLKKESEKVEEERI